MPMDFCAFSGEEAYSFCPTLWEMGWLKNFIPATQENLFPDLSYCLFGYRSRNSSHGANAFDSSLQKKKWNTIKEKLLYLPVEKSILKLDITQKCFSAKPPNHRNHSLFSHPPYGWGFSPLTLWAVSQGREDLSLYFLPTSCLWWAD